MAGRCSPGEASEPRTGPSCPEAWFSPTWGALLKGSRLGFQVSPCAGRAASSSLAPVTMQAGCVRSWAGGPGQSLACTADFREASLKAKGRTWVWLSETLKGEMALRWSSQDPATASSGGTQWRQVERPEGTHRGFSEIPSPPEHCLEHIVA